MIPKYLLNDSIERYVLGVLFLVFRHVVCDYVPSSAY